MSKIPISSCIFSKASAAQHIMTSRILDGVSGTWQFCVNRSTRHTYIFDVASEVFHVGDPEKKLNVRIVPFAIRQHLKRRVGGSGGGPCKWIGLASIDRYILAFVFDQRNARYYLISFVDNGEQIEVNINFSHLSGKLWISIICVNCLFFQCVQIADQCDIGIERMIELSYTSFSRDESDRLYCIVCANISGIRSKTIYHLARVNINATNGQISTETLVSNQSIDGLWYKPFVYRNAIVFRQGLHRLFRISIDSTDNKSALIRQIEPCSSNSVWFGHRHLSATSRTILRLRSRPMCRLRLDVELERVYVGEDADGIQSACVGKVYECWFVWRSIADAWRMFARDVQDARACTCGQFEGEIERMKMLLFVAEIDFKKSRIVLKNE